MKKHLTLIILCVILLAFAGCAKQYTALETAELPSSLQTETYNGVTASFSADDWTFDTSLDIFQLYYVPSLENEKVDNINIVLAGAYPGKIDESFLKTFLKEMDTQYRASGISIDRSEIMSFNGENIIYMECSTTITDELIDTLIEQGSITEDMIDSMGGRDVLKASGNNTQLMLHAVIDGNIATVTGSYVGEQNKNAILDGMKVLLQTAEVSA